MSAADLIIDSERRWRTSQMLAAIQQNNGPIPALYAASLDEVEDRLMATGQMYLADELAIECLFWNTFESGWDRPSIHERCESPIEIGLLQQLRLLNWRFAEAPIVVSDRAEINAVASHRGDFAMFIMPQAKIGRYRVDFLLSAMWQPGDIRDVVAVECDGHDFHERTKEQAARDRARDRALLMAGLPVLRYTGSEIYRSPTACAEQVRDFVASLWMRTI